ncbi:MAG: signal peptidase II [Verrucomicrobiota bacterium]|nr:signal peptidase II [Verrucomicrobiota bacterium]
MTEIMAETVIDKRMGKGCAKRLLLTALFIFLFDQGTKIYMTGLLESGYVFKTVIPSFFYLGYVENSGAAFGIMQNQKWFLASVAFIAIGGIYWFRKDLIGTSRFMAYTIGLISGGIVGNLLDRLRFGYVVDFIELHFGSYHYPNFNVADSAICIGVTLYILHSLITEFRTKAAAKKVNRVGTKAE